MTVQRPIVELQKMMKEVVISLLHTAHYKRKKGNKNSCLFQKNGTPHYTATNTHAYITTRACSNHNHMYVWCTSRLHTSVYIHNRPCTTSRTRTAHHTHTRLDYHHARVQTFINYLSNLGKLEKIATMTATATMNTRARMVASRPSSQKTY